MRIEVRRVLPYDAAELWEVLGDPSRYPEILPEAQRWEAIGGAAPAVCTRYTYRLRVGPTPLGGQLEIVEHEGNRDLAWTSVTGIDHRGRVQLRPASQGRTEVTIRLSYQSPGGLLGLAADRVSSGAIRNRLESAMRRLDDQLAGRPAPAEGAAPAPPTRLDQANTVLHGIGALVRSKVLWPVRPDRTVRQLARVARYGLTLPAGAEAAAAADPDAVAVIDDRGEVSYAELAELSNRLGRAFGERGIELRSRVGLLCRNHRGLVASMLACGRLGADTVLLNTGASASQLRAVLGEQEVTLLVADDEFDELLAEAPSSLQRLSSWRDEASGSPVRTLDEVAAEASPDPLPKPSRPGRLIVLTSGTTGTPKGASRSEPPIFAAAALLSKIPLQVGEPTLVSAPIFHSWGFAGWGLSLPLRSTAVLQRKFDPEAALRAIEEHRCTALWAVPVMLQRIMELPAEVRKRYDTSSLRVIAASGSALSGKLVTELLDAFGPVLYNLYGSTEVAWAAIATPTDLRAAPSTAGRPPRGTRLAILDDDGNPVHPGETGRIFVGGDMLFEGYTGGQDTKQVIGGLMATGDVGYFDDSGLLFVAGRDDDMIVSGGENVYPREVEDFLAGLGGVREVAVIGVDDEDYGQRLAAYVVTEPGASLDADGVRSAVKGQLARHSVPRDVAFLDELPRTATGKVLARELRGADRTDSDSDSDSEEG